MGLIQQLAIAHSLPMRCSDPLLGSDDWTLAPELDKGPHALAFNALSEFFVLLTSESGCRWLSNAWTGPDQDEALKQVGKSNSQLQGDAPTHRVAQQNRWLAKALYECSETLQPGAQLVRVQFLRRSAAPVTQQIWGDHLASKVVHQGLEIQSRTSETMKGEDQWALHRTCTPRVRGPRPQTQLQFTQFQYSMMGTSNFGVGPGVLAR